MAFFAMVVIHFSTVILKLKLFSTAIFKTMKMDFYAQLMQSFDLIKNVYHAAIVGRVRNIKRNDM
jgi:hypothetical protein